MAKECFSHNGKNRFEDCELFISTLEDTVSWNKSIPGCNKEGGFEEPRFRIKNSQDFFFLK